MTQVLFEEIVRYAAVESALRNYAVRLYANAAKKLSPRIEADDIATVLRADNRELYTRAGGGGPKKILTNHGKKIYTGQRTWSWEL